MKIARMVMAGIFGGCFGLAIVLSIEQGNLAMAIFVGGMFVAVFYIASWIVGM